MELTKETINKIEALKVTLEEELEATFTKYKKYLDKDGCLTKEFIQEMGGYEEYCKFIKNQKILEVLDTLI